MEKYITWSPPTIMTTTAVMTIMLLVYTEDKTLRSSIVSNCSLHLNDEKKKALHYDVYQDIFYFSGFAGKLDTRQLKEGKGK